MIPAGGWEVERVTGRAADLHAASAELVSGRPRRRVRVLDADRPAVVLGAAQSDAEVDRGRAARLGVDVARRRSGGGAVLVGPGECVWVDLVIPRDDPLWADDVGAAMRWVGELWASALGRGEVWAGPMLDTPWSGRVCFAGVGPGEVVAPAPVSPPRSGSGPRSALGPKLVGVSQRRTRGGALFQTAALLRWRPRQLLEVLTLDGAERSRAAEALAGAAEPIGSATSAEVVAALVDALP